MTMHAYRRTRRFDWRLAILEAHLPPTLKLLAFVLSMHMSRAGDSCFPGVTLLMEQSGLARATVHKGLLALITLGWLRRETHTGRGHSSEYIACFPAAVVAEIVEEATEKVSPTETVSPRQPSPPEGETVSGTVYQGRLPRESTGSTKERTKQPDEPAGFAACWAVYPSRGDSPNPRKAALKSYRAQVHKAVPEATLLAATHGYAHFCRNKGITGSDKVLMASTFFGPNDRYVDFVLRPAPVRAAPPPPAPEPVLHDRPANAAAEQATAAFLARLDRAASAPRGGSPKRVGEILTPTGGTP